MVNHEHYFISQVLSQPDIVYKTTLTDADFLTPSCRAIFITVKSLLQRNMTPDLPTIYSENTDISPTQLSQLSSVSMSPANWKYYEGKIKEAKRVLGLRKVCEHVLTDTLMTSSDMVEQLMTEIDRYCDSGDYRITDNKTSLLLAVDEIEDAYKRKGEIIGVPSGVKALDRKINGFQKRRLYIVGARPSQGKTAMLINFMLNSHKSVGFMSAESSMRELDKRLISLNGRINNEHLATGMMGTTGFAKMNEAVADLYDRTYYYYDEPNMSIETLTLKAREMKQRYGIDALYIDYLQQVQSTHREKRNEQVADVSTKLKALARNLDIPVICAAQLRRDVEGKVPELHDLGDSGQIERDADIVMMIHHGEIKDKVKGETREGTFLLVRKNRDGDTGAIELVFKKEYYGFYEIERQGG